MNMSQLSSIAPIAVIVSDLLDLTSTIKFIVMRSADGALLPAYTAGAHIRVQVILPGGILGERCYSLVNVGSIATEGNACYEIAVQREANGKGGSAFMHRLEIGSQLSIWPPKNDFPLQPDSTHSVLIAGGIGITPILSMAHALRSNHQSFEFHYGTRSPELMAFKDVVQEFSHTTLYFDGGDPQRGLQLQTLLAKPISRHHVYVCGPRGLIDAVIATSKRNGWPDDQVHFELFNAYSGQSGDVEFEVELRASGKTLRVPADQSILDIILASGCELMHECKRGECGMCAVRVLEGVPDHRDYNLPEDERASGKVMCVCVSRAKTQRLVLDV